MFTILALSLLLGALLTKVIPTGKTSGKYEPATEADFEELLRRRGLQ